jgi:Trk-type K+ transport system membrane component
MLPSVRRVPPLREIGDRRTIHCGGGLTMAGGSLWRRLGRPGVITTKEGFAAVGLAWFVISAFGTLPYLLTGSMPNLTDAFFESVADSPPPAPPS